MSTDDLLEGERQQPDLPAATVRQHATVGGRLMLSETASAPAWVSAEPSDARDLAEWR